MRGRRHRAWPGDVQFAKAEFATGVSDTNSKKRLPNEEAVFESRLEICLRHNFINLRLNGDFYISEIQPLFITMRLDICQWIGHGTADNPLNSLLGYTPIQQILEGGFALDDAFCGFCFRMFLGLVCGGRLGLFLRSGTY